MAKIILLEKTYFHISRKWNSNNNSFMDLDALFASLYPHYYSFPRSSCTTQFNAKKEVSKEFSFSSYSSIFTLDTVKKNFIKDNLKPKSRSQKSIQRFRLMHLSYFFMTEKTCRVSFRALVSTSWKKPVVEDTIWGILSNTEFSKFA